MLNSKKGQLTYFIIIGISIVAFFGFVFYERNAIASMFTPDSGITPIQEYVESCVDLVARYGIYKMGVQGGWIDLPSNSYSDGIFSIAYAYSNEKTFITLDGMNRQLSSFVSANLPVCLKDFKDFSSQGYKIEPGNISTDALFAEKDVLVKVKMPLKITRGGFFSEPDKFTADIPVAMKTIHSDVDGFVSDFGERYDRLYLARLNSNIYISSLGATDLLVEENLDSRLAGDNYLFMWVVK